jgi:hypothetical protein
MSVKETPVWQIISEMESARYARRKVERGAKGEVDL